MCYFFRLAVLVGVTIVLSATGRPCFAQFAPAADPFGSDPFGSAPSAMPLKKLEKLDPFGDPLPRPVENDPFGEPQQPKLTRMNPTGNYPKFRADSRDDVIKKASDDKLFPPVDEQLRKRIKIDIENLADERRVARKSADDLVQIGLDSVPQLAAATKSTDKLVAARATYVIERLVDHTNLLLDEKGLPLTGATIQYTLSSNKKVQIKSDRLGHVVLDTMPFGVPVKVSHPDYENQIEATTDIFKPIWVKLALRKKATP